MTHVGKYQLARKLANGGMAEVFLAKAEGPMGFEKTLVLKRILPHLAEDPQFVGMFLSEARLAAQLNHPNIVQIFDFGQSDGSYYLAMEYIDGMDLRTLSTLARDAGVLLPPAVCAKIVSSACEGLAFAHDFVDPATGQPMNLIHRDISPDNILLSRQGGVKVVDFGIAKASKQGHKTQTGLVKGKIAYMPIEQLQAQPLDRRVDVYALGIVLYELLTGHRPFEASTDVSILQAVLFEPLIPAASRRPDLPEALTQILDKAISKVREQRYPDCRAFQADLERYILSTGEPVGPWQLAQWVTRLAPESGRPQAPVNPTDAALGFAATSLSPKPDTGPQPEHPLEPTHLSAKKEVSNPALSSSTAAFGAVQAPPVTSQPQPPPPRDTLVLPKKAEPAPVRRPSRAGLWGALGGLALLAAGSGVVLFRGGTPVAPPPAVQAVPTPSAQAPAVVEPPPVAPLPVQPAPVAAAPEAPPSEAPPQEVPAAPSAPAPVAQAEPPAAPAAPVVRRKESQKGRLEFRIRPYATVLLDGTALGQTPLAPVSVSAGSHTLRFINRELGKDVTRTVEVKAGKPTIFKLDLTAE